MKWDRWSTPNQHDETLRIAADDGVLVEQVQQDHYSQGLERHYVGVRIMNGGRFVFSDYGTHVPITEEQFLRLLADPDAAYMATLL